MKTVSLKIALALSILISPQAFASRGEDVVSASSAPATSLVQAGERRWNRNVCYEFAPGPERSRPVPLSELRSETDRYFCGRSGPRGKELVEGAYMSLAYYVETPPPVPARNYDERNNGSSMSCGDLAMYRRHYRRLTRTELDSLIGGVGDLERMGALTCR